MRTWRSAALPLLFLPALLAAQAPDNTDTRVFYESVKYDCCTTDDRHLDRRDSSDACHAARAANPRSEHAWLCSGQRTA